MGSILLDVKDLSIKYDSSTLISNASFSFVPGDIVLLEGDNGVGKTTLMKSMLGFSSKNMQMQGFVSVCGSDNVLAMNEKQLSLLRSRVSYLEQKDSYDSYTGVTVKDVLSDSLEAFRNARLKKNDYSFIEETFNKYIPKETGLTLRSKVNRLSGGQQRLISIVASLCLRKDSEVFLIDEPLNNLDIKTIVHISNIINTIRIENPETIMVIISHCKIFPFITKVASIKDHRVIVSNDSIVCNTCFGLPDASGFFKW